MKIMIVEDDWTIAEHLEEVLLKWNFQVKLVDDFQDVRQAFHDWPADLILLDVNLPYYNGYHWCQEIRKESKVPIIFISSMDDRMDMVMAMQLGADDYVTKPLDAMVLMSKIQALLRRTYDYSLQHDSFTYHKARLILSKAELHYQDTLVDLTATELQILAVLFQQPERYLKREEILDYCWQNDRYIDDNTLAVNISRIRRKFKEAGIPDLIDTKKNYGYRLYEEG